MYYGPTLGPDAPREGAIFAEMRRIGRMHSGKAAVPKLLWDFLLLFCALVCLSLAADSIDSSLKHTVNADGAHLMNGDSNTGAIIALC